MCILFFVKYFYWSIHNYTNYTKIQVYEFTGVKKKVNISLSNTHLVTVYNISCVYLLHTYTYYMKTFIAHGFVCLGECWEGGATSIRVYCVSECLKIRACLCLWRTYYRLLTCVPTYGAIDREIERLSEKRKGRMKRDTLIRAILHVPIRLRGRCRERKNIRNREREKIRKREWVSWWWWERFCLWGFSICDGGF